VHVHLAADDDAADDNDADENRRPVKLVHPQRPRTHHHAFIVARADRPAVRKPERRALGGGEETLWEAHQTCGVEGEVWTDGRTPSQQRRQTSRLQPPPRRALANSSWPRTATKNRPARTAKPPPPRCVRVRARAGRRRSRIANPLTGTRPRSLDFDPDDHDERLDGSLDHDNRLESTPLPPQSSDNRSGSFVPTFDSPEESVLVSDSTLSFHNSQLTQLLTSTPYPGGTRGSAPRVSRARSINRRRAHAARAGTGFRVRPANSRSQH
jgi:hypothetical protein